jgi:hypothetical protein
MEFDAALLSTQEDGNFGRFKDLKFGYVGSPDEERRRRSSEGMANRDVRKGSRRRREGGEGEEGGFWAPSGDDVRKSALF